MDSPAQLARYLLLALLLGGCASAQRQALPANATECVEPRPQICTMDYNPVCATRDNGIVCQSTPCASTERATYANACGACADTRVYFYVPGACPE